MINNIGMMSFSMFSKFTIGTQILTFKANCLAASLIILVSKKCCCSCQCYWYPPLWDKTVQVTFIVNYKGNSLNFGYNYTDQCCYWYQRVPGNYSDCHVSHNGTAVLRCEVYAPHDSNNNSMATLKWYRNIESVVEDISDRYENVMMTVQVAFNDSNSPINGLFQDNYKLIIRSINSSDSGVYWCHLSADELCFIPSAYVNITVNTSLNKNGCSSVNYQRSPVCAVVDNSSSCQVTPTPSLQTMSSIVTPISPVMTSITPSATTTQLELCRGDLNVTNLGFAACLGVTVPAGGFTLILMIILICCAGICICWKKKTRKKGEWIWRSLYKSTLLL